MVEWIEVGDSTRVIAVAYDADSETIFVRFPNGREWGYEGCPPHVWEQFTAPGVSKGALIAQVLNYHRHGPA